MNTIRYVFSTRQPQLQGLVVKYGLPPARTPQELWHKVNFCVSKFREKFMKDLADIHPDKDLFAWSFSLDNNTPSKQELENIAKNTTVETTSSCCGSGVDGEKTSNCCGSGIEGSQFSDCNACEGMQSGIDGAVIKEKIKDNMPLIIVGSLALVFGVIALTK